MMLDNGKLSVNKEEIEVDKSTDTFVRQMWEFVGAILSDREPMPSGRDVLPTMALLDAAMDGLVAPGEGTLRNICCACLTEFLRWSVKHDKVPHCGPFGCFRLWLI